jgi:hypothetical protein
LSIAQKSGNRFFAASDAETKKHGLPAAIGAARRAEKKKDR